LDILMGGACMRKWGRVVSQDTMPSGWTGSHRNRAAEPKPGCGAETGLRRLRWRSDEADRRFWQVDRGLAVPMSVQVRWSQGGRCRSAARSLCYPCCY